MQFGTAKVAAAFAALMLACAPVGAQTVYKFRVQSNDPTGSVTFGMLKETLDKVRVASAGRLDIELLGANAVVAVSQTLDAIKDGVLDGHETGPVLFSGKDAAYSFIGDLTGGYTDGLQTCGFMDTGGGLEILRELNAKFDAYVVAATCYGPESMISTKPLRTLADVKGLKVRTPPGLEQDVFARLGATPVNLPATEIYTAIERKVIDAADWGTLTHNDQQGLHKIAKFPLWNGWHSNGVGEFSLKKAKWDALPPDLKQILETALKEHRWNKIMRLMVMDHEVAARLRSEGMQVLQPTPESFREVRKVAAEVWKEWSTKSPMAKKAYDAHIAYMTKLGLL